MPQDRPRLRLHHAVTSRLAIRTARALSGLDSPGPIISFTFDDVAKSAVTTGSEILESHGVRGSFYPTVALAGRTVEGVRHYDVEDLTRLAAAGHEIGCHGVDHLRLTHLDDAAVARQFDRAGYASLGVQPDWLQTLAYPYGDVSPRVKRLARQRFAAARGVWPGVNGRIFDRMLLQCVSLEPHILAQLPVQGWIDLAVAEKGWLIFLAHEVQDDHGPFGVTPALLDATLRAAVRSGAMILPIRDALRHTIPLDQGPGKPSGRRWWHLSGRDGA